MLKNTPQKNHIKRDPKYSILDNQEINKTNNNHENIINKSDNKNIIKNGTLRKEEIRNDNDNIKYDSLYSTQQKKNIKEFNENENLEHENASNGLDIKELTLSIFLNYSKFSKEEFQFLLSYQSLIKILKTVKIMDDLNNNNTLLKKQDFDLLFKKANSNLKNININQFNNFLVNMSNKLFKKEFEADPKTCVIDVIIEFFTPLYELLQQFVLENPETELYIHQSTVNKFSEIQLDNSIIIIINSILPGLKNLYLNFFGMENSKTKEFDKIYKDSFCQIIKFCQIYEIMPFIVSLDKLAIYFNLITRMKIEDMINNEEIKNIVEPQKELGILFTLSKFIILIFHFSVLNYDKYSIYLKKPEYSMRMNTQIGIHTKNFGNGEKFILFLERIQNLETNYIPQEKANFRNPNHLKFNIIPMKEIINLINPELIMEKSQKMSIVRSASRIDHEIIKNIEIKSSNNENIDIRTIFNFDSDDLFLKLQQHLENLKDIFESYAMIGDKTDITNLSLTGYLKFLNDCELIYENQNANFKKELNRVKSNQNFNNNNNDYYRLRETNPTKKINFYDCNFSPIKSNISLLQDVPKGKISKNNICIVFNYVCGLRKCENTNFNNSYRRFEEIPEAQILHRVPDLSEKSHLKSSRDPQLQKMNFPIFLKSFEFLARKIYPNSEPDKALEQFLDIDLVYMLRNKSQTVTLKKNLIDNLLKLRGDDIIDLLRSLVNLIYPHFSNYADLNELIDFEGVYKFFKDFEIFPNLLNLIQLKTIFSSLHEILSEDLEIEYKFAKEIKENNKINFNSFMDSLLLTSIHIKIEEDLNPIERILYLIQRMSRSKGVNKSLLKSGKFL